MVGGVDLAAGYGFDVGQGRLSVRGSARWLDSEQQTNAQISMFDLSGTLFNPARRKARFGAVWSSGGLSGSGFFNHTGGVTNTLDGIDSGSFTTLDATLRYATSEHAGLWRGMEFALLAQNLLNREPPGYNTASILSVHFDSTNYSPIGRFASLLISKHW